MPSEKNRTPGTPKSGENAENRPKRIGWMPKCRAATLSDRRTRRNRTRGDQNRRAIEENS